MIVGGEIVKRDKPQAGVTESWRLYSSDDGLISESGLRITQRADGSIWITSNWGLGGVNRFDGQRWIAMKLSSVGGEDINPSLIETQDGVLWVSGKTSLHVYRDSTWQIFNQEDVSFPLHRAQFLETSDNALWVAGLGTYAVRFEYQKVPELSFQGLHFKGEDEEGAYWFLDLDIPGVVCYEPLEISDSGQMGTRPPRGPLLDMLWPARQTERCGVVRLFCKDLMAKPGQRSRMWMVWVHGLRRSMWLPMAICGWVHEPMAYFVTMVKTGVIMVFKMGCQKG